jgi:hypothetical protein
MQLLMILLKAGGDPYMKVSSYLDRRNLTEDQKKFKQLFYMCRLMMILSSPRVVHRIGKRSHLRYLPQDLLKSVRNFLGNYNLVCDFRNLLNS